MAETRDLLDEGSTIGELTEPSDGGQLDRDWPDSGDSPPLQVHPARVTGSFSPRHRHSDQPWRREVSMAVAATAAVTITAIAAVLVVTSSTRTSETAQSTGTSVTTIDLRGAKTDDSTADPPPTSASTVRQAGSFGASTTTAADTSISAVKVVVTTAPTTVPTTAPETTPVIEETTSTSTPTTAIATLATTAITLAETTVVVSQPAPPLQLVAQLTIDFSQTNAGSVSALPGVAAAPDPSTFGLIAGPAAGSIALSQGTTVIVTATQNIGGDSARWAMCSVDGVCYEILLVITHTG